MFEGLVRGVQAAASAAVRARVAGVAEALRAALPGVEVSVSNNAVSARGRGLTRKWLDSAALRFVGSGR